MFPSANTNLAGSAWNEGMSQDVVFVGEGNRVYDLNYYGLRYYPNPGSGANIPGPGYYPWAVFDVIKIGDQIAQVTMPLPISVAATPRGGSPLAVFTSPVSSTGLGLGGPVGNVLVYIGDNHTIEAVYLVNQSPLNLTQASGTEKHPQPTGNSLAAWSWLGQRSQHVVYVDADNNVSELYSVNSLFHWSYNNLSGHTGYTGTNSPRRNSPLVGNAFENQGTQHVFYIAQDNTIRELVYSDGWSGNNLSHETTAPLPAASTPLAGYVCEYDSTQHVIYIAENGDIQELWWSSRTGWVAGHPNLTQTTGTPKPAANSALAAYSCEYERSEHVIYVGNDGNLHELYNIRGGWATTNLSLSPGSQATPPVDGTPLTGYSWESDHTQHVFYVDINKNVHELYRLGDSWGTGVLSAWIPVMG